MPISAKPSPERATEITSDLKKVASYFQENREGRFGDGERFVICQKAIEMIESLQAQVAESQRRERAAVEDLHLLHSVCMNVGGCCPECGNQIDDLVFAACDFCKNSGMGCWVETPGDENRCAAFEWRGPQEADELKPTPRELIELPK